MATVEARRTQSDTAPVWGVAVVSAAGLSLLASSAPDGLERVLGDVGVAVDGPGSILHSSPLADYALTGMSGPLSSAAAGVLGVLAAAALCLGVASLTRTDRARAHAPVAP